MVKLVSDLIGPFGYVQRPVRVDGVWFDKVEIEGERAPLLAGPVIVDVYQEMIDSNEDDLVARLFYGAMTAGILLNEWTVGDVMRLKSAFWRSAHKFIVDNINSVDRGPELEELARLLKVDS